jgi:hypothetical protein
MPNKMSMRFVLYIQEEYIAVRDVNRRRTSCTLDDWCVIKWSGVFDRQLERWVIAEWKRIAALTLINILNDQSGLFYHSGYLDGFYKHLILTAEESCPKLLTETQRGEYYIGFNKGAEEALMQLPQYL